MTSVMTARDTAGRGPREQLQDICEAGAAKLDKGLGLNSVLQHIDFQNNGIGAEGAGFLCEEIAKKDAVKRLDLSFNGPQDAGAGHVADMLAATSTLQELRLP